MYILQYLWDYKSYQKSRLATINQSALKGILNSKKQVIQGIENITQLFQVASQKSELYFPLKSYEKNPFFQLSFVSNLKKIKV